MNLAETARIFSCQKKKRKKKTKMGKLCKNIEQSILEYTHKARKRVEERQQNLSGPQPLLCHFQCSIFHFFTWKLWCCSHLSAVFSILDWYLEQFQDQQNFLLEQHLVVRGIRLNLRRSKWLNFFWSKLVARLYKSIRSRIHSWFGSYHLYFLTHMYINIRSIKNLELTCYFL